MRTVTLPAIRVVAWSRTNSITFLCPPLAIISVSISVTRKRRSLPKLTRPCERHCHGINYTKNLKRARVREPCHPGSKTVRRVTEHCGSRLRWNPDLHRVWSLHCWKTMPCWRVRCGSIIVVTTALWPDTGKLEAWFYSVCTCCGMRGRAKRTFKVLISYGLACTVTLPA